MATLNLTEAVRKAGGKIVVETTIRVRQGARKLSFAHTVYNAARDNGGVYVLSGLAPDEYRNAEKITDETGTFPVIVNAQNARGKETPRTAESVYETLERHNALNDTKHDKYGKVEYNGLIYIGDELIGFRVDAVAVEVSTDQAPKSA